MKHILCTEGSCTVAGQDVLGVLVLSPCAEQTDPKSVSFECLVSSELADTVFDLWYEQAKLDTKFKRVCGLCVDADIFDDLGVSDDYFENEGKEYVAVI